MELLLLVAPNYLRYSNAIRSQVEYYIVSSLGDATKRRRIELVAPLGRTAFRST